MKIKLSEYIHSYKSIISLAVPIIIGQIGTIITGLADTIMVGQHSTEELAASAFVNNIFTLFMVFGVGFTFNFTPLVGNALAQKDGKDVGMWLKNSLFANSIMTFGLLLGLVLVYFNIEKMGQPVELLHLIKPYFLVYCVSIIPIMLYCSFRHFVETALDASTSMWIFLIGNLMNIGGNYILIYGKLGLPELGLYGAGISTLISRCLMLIAFIIVFLTRKKYSEYRKGFVQGEIILEKFKTLYKVGTPIALQQGFETTTFCVTAIMVGWLGSLTLAAHQVVTSISVICYMTYLGLGNAVAIRVSHYNGSGDAFSIKKYTYAGVHLGLVASVTISLILIFSIEKISMVFTDNADVAKIVVILVPSLILYQMFDSVQLVLSNALRALEDVKSIMYISLIAYFFIAIPAGYFFGFKANLGINGLWLAYPVGFIFSTITFYLRFKHLTKN